MFAVAVVVGLRGGGAYLSTHADDPDRFDRWTHEAKLLWAVPPLLVAGFMFLIVG